MMILVFLLSGMTIYPDRATAQEDAPNYVIQGREEVNPYYTIEHLVFHDGSAMDRNIINGPSKRPGNSESSLSGEQGVDAILSNFPSFSWVFGCSAVSGAMITTYYDRNGFPNMYSGPTNGGVFPLTDTGFGTWRDSTNEAYPNNPLVASKSGLDGHSGRGSIEDYWVPVDSSAPDPYITGGWTQHLWGNSIGDYMKTSQSAFGNVDGSTAFYTWTNSPEKLTCAKMSVENLPDGTLGIRDFFQARGYLVSECYNQKTDNNNGGFSLVDFKRYIDSGHPVLINLEGHSIVGYGYSGSTIYIRDTWSSNVNETFTMPWGGSYEGMQMQSVSVVVPVDHSQLHQKVYLPIIFTPPIIKNGNFEQGNTAWSESSTHGWYLIYQDSELARDGEWLAWLGGGDNERSVLSQVVTLPSGTNYLEFYYAIGSMEQGCQYDSYEVQFGNNTLLSGWLCAPNNTNGYVYKRINLSAYSGTTQALKFIVENDASDNSNLFLDDVNITRQASKAIDETKTASFDSIFLLEK
jgi:hypothetical protein